MSKKFAGKMCQPFLNNFEIQWCLFQVLQNVDFFEVISKWIF